MALPQHIPKVVQSGSGGGGAPSAFTVAHESTFSGNSFSESIDIGAASSDRFVVVLFSTTQDINVPTLTIGGSSANPSRNNFWGSTTGTGYRLITTGTSTTVAVTFNRSDITTRITVLVLRGFTSFGGGDSSGTSNTVIDAEVPTANNGIVLGICTMERGADCVWNISEQADVNFTGTKRSSWAVFYPASSGSKTVTVSSATSSNDKSLTILSFSP